MKIRTLTLVALTIMMALPAQAQPMKQRVQSRVYTSYAESPQRKNSVQYGRYGHTRVTPSTRSGAGYYTYYGFRLGLTGGTINADDPFYDAGGMRSGLNASFNADILLTPYTPLFFETGLQYIEKGGKKSSGAEKLTYSLNYLEVPLLLKYQLKLDNNIAVTPFLGGYLACGIGGKIKDQNLRMSENSFTDNNFKRFDGGLRLGCGMMLDMFYVEAGYDVGLANISQDSFDSAHTGTLFANNGFNF